jgi:hypothetical protein
MLILGFAIAIVLAMAGYKEFGFLFLGICAAGALLVGGFQMAVIFATPVILAIVFSILVDRR